MSKEGISKRNIGVLLSFSVLFLLAILPINNLTTGFHISLNEGTDMIKEMQEITDKFDQNVIGVLNYSNIPNFFSSFF